MKKFTKTCSTLLAAMLVSVLVFGQSAQEKDALKLQQMHEKFGDAIPGMEMAKAVKSNFDYTKLVNTEGTKKNVLYDNGGFITQPGAGSDGSDYSDVQDASLGMQMLGFGFSPTSDYSIADDFVVTETWTVQTFTFFGYQTGSGTVSTLNDVRFQIYDGDPSAGGTVIYGDMTTNKMVSTDWTNVWRTMESGPTENRPIMEIVADAEGLVLPAGTYWVEWSVDASGSDDPWAPPITFLGQSTTGNGMANTDSGDWIPLEDIGPQGLPFIIDGTGGTQNADDLAITYIISPSSGVLLGVEDVTIRINNYGTNVQNDFNVSYTINGGGEITETVSATIDSYDYYDYTFAVSADLSTIGNYEIVACVNLVGDENPNNDCLTKTVENYEPSLCVPEYTTGCSFGDGFTDFALEQIVNNGTGCEDNMGLGWSQYLDLGPAELTADYTYTVTMIAGYQNNFATIWIDYNDDLEFTNDEQIIFNYALPDGGIMADVEFTVPADALDGTHMMRARTAFGGDCLDACESYPYGEAEDYYVTIEGGTTSGCEDFDALTAGGLVAEQLGGLWTTWSGTSTDDATVSDMYSNSPNNSFVVDAGAVDLIYKFGDAALDAGNWLYSNYIYVPAGYSGYFNVQSDPTPGVEWVVDLFFDDDGTGSFGTSSTATFTYEQDTWINVEINFDLDADFAEVYFDGALMTVFEWDGTIGGVDYFGLDQGGTPGAYYDDVCFGEGWVYTSVEEQVVTTTQMYPNPATDLVNISSDCTMKSVTVYNFAGQVILTKTINSSTYRINTSNFDSGIYLFQIETQEGRIAKRIIIE